MPRLIDSVNSLVTGLFDLLLSPLGPLLSLTLVSLATGLMMLWVFKLVSNQEKIATDKNRLQSHLLGLRLFQNVPGVFLRLQGRIVLDSLIYLRHSLKPVLVMIVPLLIVLVQLNGRYGLRPLEVGEAATVTVTVDDPSLLETAGGITLYGAEGVVVETPAVRIPSRGECAWRVRADREGEFLLTVLVGERRISKKIVAGAPGPLLSSRRVGRGLLNMLVNPGEAPLDPSSPARSVAVVYPPLDITLSGWRIDWLVGFLVLSITFAYLLKAPLGVEI